MLFRLNEPDRSFGLMSELHRRMDEALSAAGLTDFPRLDDGLRLKLEDEEGAYVLTADAPGVADSDIELTLKEEVLTLSVKRELVPPEGYRFHLRERRPIQLTRAFALPGKVDPERVKAHLQDGVLTIRLAKAEAAQPLRIDITAG